MIQYITWHYEAHTIGLRGSLAAFTIAWCFQENALVSSVHRYPSMELAVASSAATDAQLHAATMFGAVARSRLVKVRDLVIFLRQGP